MGINYNIIIKVVSAVVFLSAVAMFIPILQGLYNGDEVLAFLATSLGAIGTSSLVFLKVL